MPNDGMRVGQPGVPQVDPAAGNEIVRIDGASELEKVNRVSAKLDAILLKAAKIFSAPVDAKALRATAADAGFSWATRRKIESAAKKAQSSFLAVNRFSARQIVEGLAKDDGGRYSWDLSSPAGKAMRTALDDMAKLSSLLAKEKVVADFRDVLKPLAKRIDDLKARLTEDQVTVATKRLDSAIKHAESLKDKKFVIATEDWSKQDVQRRIVGTPPPLPAVGGKAPLINDFTEDVQLKACERQQSYFCHHLIKSIAKLDWFEKGWVAERQSAV